MNLQQQLYQKRIMPVSLLIFIFLLMPIMVMAQTFTQITTGSLVSDGGNSTGSSWGDYDNDNDPDLFVTNIGQNNFFYQNNGDGTFNRISGLNIVNDGGNSYGSSWGDYNNDGFIDLCVANYGQPNFLYLNNGNGTFTKILDGEIVNDSENSYSCSWGDYDDDGFLDLIVANFEQNNSLYHNKGDGTFTKITTGDVVNDGGNSKCCTWIDYDNDRLLDIFILNERQNNFLYRNNGDGSFTKDLLSALVPNDRQANSCSWGDYNNDCYLDLVVVHNNQEHVLYTNNGDGTFTRVSSGVVVTDRGNSYGSNWVDYDNDGDLDLYVTNFNASNYLYQNIGNGNFSKIEQANILSEGRNSYSSSWVDANNDGFADLFMAVRFNRNNVAFLNNGNDNNWISIKCIGTTSNASAIGAKIKVKALIDGEAIWQLRVISGQSGFNVHNGLKSDFGLGDAAVADSIVINWPCGIVHILTDVPANQTLVLEEPIIHLDIGTVYAYPREIVQVPVHAQFPPYFNFNSAEFAIGGYFGHLEFLNIETDYTLTGEAGWTFQTNETEDANIVWFAGAEPISGEGVLFEMKFRVGDVDSGFFPITIQAAAFDTNNLPVKFVNGGVHILTPYYGDVDLNRKIQAYDAALILKYLVGMGNLNTLQLANANVSLDSTVSALDATLILQYGVGLIDSLPYPGEQGAFYATGDIAMQDGITQANRIIEIPVVVNEGNNIFSFEGDIEYDPQYLTFENISWSNLTQKFMIDVHEKDGKIQIAGAGVEPKVNINGLFATIRFAENEQFVNNATAISIKNFRWNENQSLKEISLTVNSNAACSRCLSTTAPLEYALGRNFPNPFNPTTTIHYSLKEAGAVQILIYNQMGHLVKTLVNSSQSAGIHAVVWDSTNERSEMVSSGVYFYILKVGTQALFTQKMILIK